MKNFSDKIKKILLTKITFKKSLIALSVAVLISTFVIVTPTKPANALFGAGDITLINIQEFVTDLAESLLQSFVESLAGQLTSRAINTIISKYKIGSYLQYANNLMSQVYVVQAMNDDEYVSNDQVEQYILRSMITDITNNPIKQTNLNPLLVKEALTFFDPTKSTSQAVGLAAETFMANSLNPRSGYGGQYFASLDRADIVQQRAQSAAAHDISTANGYKSSYNCTQVAKNTGQYNMNLYGSQIQTDCLLQNPGNYVGNALNGEISGLLNRQDNGANNHVGTIAVELGSAVGRTFASIAENSILNATNSSTIGSDNQTPPDTTPPPSTPPNPSTYGTVYALDSNNNLLAGSSATATTTPINNGQTYTLVWNASAVSGAQYAAFAPCSTTNCSGSADQLPSAGTKQETMSGSSQTYTIQIWGTASGASSTTAPTILQTDTIRVVSNGTLFALDSNNKLITGSASTTSTPIASGSTYTVNWNAVGLAGAQYAAFTPCSTTNCASSPDKLSLSGNKQMTMSGAIQNYTLQIWGTSGSSSTVSVIETDNITVKSQ